LLENPVDENEIRQLELFEPPKIHIMCRRAINMSQYYRSVIEEIFPTTLISLETYKERKASLVKYSQL